jgi:hypothetical protein
LIEVDDGMRPKQKPWGRDRLYNKQFVARGREDVVSWDVLPITDGEVVKVVFESVNSDRRQGIWLRTDRGLDVNGQRCPSVSLWHDTAPKEVLCKCHTSEGYLSVYNTYMDSTGVRMSQGAASGMLIEELENGRRYRCNDSGFETDFDRLVFRIERVERGQ